MRNNRETERHYAYADTTSRETLVLILLVIGLVATLVLSVAL